MLLHTLLSTSQQQLIIITNIVNTPNFSQYIVPITFFPVILTGAKSLVHFLIGEVHGGRVQQREPNLCSVVTPRWQFC